MASSKFGKKIFNSFKQFQIELPKRDYSNFFLIITDILLLMGEKKSQLPPLKDMGFCTFFLVQG